MLIFSLQQEENNFYDRKQTVCLTPAPIGQRLYRSRRLANPLGGITRMKVYQEVRHE
jgi:hypothetical protein